MYYAQIIEFAEHAPNLNMFKNFIGDFYKDVMFCWDLSTIYARLDLAACDAVTSWDFATGSKPIQKIIHV